MPPFPDTSIAADATDLSSRFCLTCLEVFDTLALEENHREVIDVSNAIGIIVGAVLVVLGFVLLVAWWSMFIKALMAIVPILLILIGAGVLAYFVSETKSRVEAAPEKGPEPEEKKAAEK